MLTWLQRKKKAINPKNTYSGGRKRSQNRTATAALRLTLSEKKNNLWATHGYRQGRKEQVLTQATFAAD